jgi:hypothetical protein
MWGGVFVVEPGAKTGIHHHGEQETIAYVLRLPREAVPMDCGAKHSSALRGEPPRRLLELNHPRVRPAIRRKQKRFAAIPGKPRQRL